MTHGHKDILSPVAHASMRLLLNFDELMCATRQTLDLGDNEVRVLGRLTFQGPTSAADLARKLSMSRGGMSAVLKRLVADGWIRVEDDAEDGRRSLVTATSRVDAIAATWTDGIDAVVADLGTARHLLPRALDRAAENVSDLQKRLSLLGPAEQQSLSGRTP